MLKYHNFDKENEPLELYYNGKRLESIDAVIGRDVISKMRSTYFHLFDLISITDFDDTKKRLLKNKIKAITVDVYGKLLNTYNKSKDISIFTEALSVDGIVVKHVDEFASYVFNDTSQNREYFIKESIRVFSDSIFSLALLKEQTN